MTEAGACSWKESESNGRKLFSVLKGHNVFQHNKFEKVLILTQSDHKNYGQVEETVSSELPPEKLEYHAVAICKM